MANNEWEIYINNKKVVNKSKINEILKQMWLNPLYGGVGLNRFYNHIKLKFIGITKQSVYNFLNNLESYQLHKKLIKTTSINPIIPSQPYQYFQMDLIDMSKYAKHNNGYFWILTILDLFTKKVFTIPLKNKEAITVAKALEKWLQLILPFKPKTIQSDRGPEFVNDNVKILFKTHKIYQQLSDPYMPQTQGAIERFNGTLKRMIFSYFTIYTKNIWIDILAKLTENYNSSIHSITNSLPKNAQYKPQKILHQLQTSAFNKLQTEPKLSLLQLGDSVRISLQTTAEYRKDIFRKKYLVQWSKELFVIATIIPASNFNTTKYTLFDSFGVHKTKKYSRYQLQYIDKSKLILNEINRPNYNKILLPNFQNKSHILNNNNNSATIIKSKLNSVITRTQTKQTQNKPLTQQEINKKFGLHNFTIDTNIKLPTQQKIITKQIQNKPLTQQEINKKYGLLNFTIDTNIKLPTQPNVLTTNKSNLKALSQQKINNKYGLQNFTINIEIKVPKKL